MRGHGANIHRFAILLAIPLLLSGVGYAVFSQNLTISAESNIPVFVATQYLSLTYTKTLTNDNGQNRYSISMTVRNNGVAQVNSWKIVFDMPEDGNTLWCPTAVVCTNNGRTVTIDNGTSNARINVNSTRTFTMRFRTAEPDYTLQNVYVSGTYASAFVTIAGLTETVTKGTRTRVGSVYQWPMTMTVTNSTAVTLPAWQMTIPWSSSRSVISMPPEVNYTTNATQMLITSTQPIAPGEVYQFVPVLGSTKSSWNISATIKGTPP